MAGKPRNNVAAVEFWHWFSPKEWKAFAEGAEGKPAPCTEAADPDLYYAWGWGNTAQQQGMACQVAGGACTTPAPGGLGAPVPTQGSLHGPHDFPHGSGNPPPPPLGEDFLTGV